MPQAFDGFRVIDTTHVLAGPFASYQLGVLGAEVIKVEPPGGGPTRQIGPFYQDRPDPEGSLFFWQYNRGKRSVELDIATTEGRARFDALVASADVLLESTPKGTLDAAALAQEAEPLTVIHAGHLIAAPGEERVRDQVSILVRGDEIEAIENGYVTPDGAEIVGIGDACGLIYLVQVGERTFSENVPFLSTLRTFPLAL